MLNAQIQVMPVPCGRREVFLRCNDSLGPSCWKRVIPPRFALRSPGSAGSLTCSLPKAPPEGGTPNVDLLNRATVVQCSMLKLLSMKSDGASATNLALQSHILPEWLVAEAPSALKQRFGGRQNCRTPVLINATAFSHDREPPVLGRTGGVTSVLLGNNYSLAKIAKLAKKT